MMNENKPKEITEKEDLLSDVMENLTEIEDTFHFLDSLKLVKILEKHNIIIFGLTKEQNDIFESNYSNNLTDRQVQVKDYNKSEFVTENNYDLNEDEIYPITKLLYMNLKTFDIFKRVAIDNEI